MEYTVALTLLAKQCQLTSTDAAYDTVFVVMSLDLTSTGKYTGGSAATLAQSCTQMWLCRVTWTWA